MIESAPIVPWMREAFAGLPFRRLTTTYTVGASSTSRKPSGELLIANFPL